MNFLLSVLGLFGRILGPIWRWLTADLRNALLALFGGIILCHGLVIDPALRGQIADGEAALALERKAHDDTIAGYREAEAEAALQDRDNVARVKGEQAAITQEIVDDYEVRLSDVRVRAARVADRLRAEAAANSGSGTAAPVSGLPDATGRIDAAPGQGGLPAPGLNIGDALLATEQALQLDALIHWVDAQARVDVNGEPGS